jgi:PAS domain S-box-containing protein
MKLWLILLGVAIGLGIALRRVLRRQSPLNDELHSQQVAVAHVQSGVGWVRGDQTFGSVNQSFADTFKMLPRDFTGREWYKIFGPDDHTRVRESYGQMMLMGMTSFEAAGERGDGSLAWLRVRLVAVHDGQMRLVGHQCMIDDKTHERDLEQLVRDLEERLKNVQCLEQVQRLEQSQTPPVPAPDQPAAQPVQSANGSSASRQLTPSISPSHELDSLRRAAGRSVISSLNSLRKSTIPRPESSLTEKR